MLAGVREQLSHPFLVPGRIQAGSNGGQKLSIDGELVELAVKKRGMESGRTPCVAHQPAQVRGTWRWHWN